MPIRILPDEIDLLAFFEVEPEVDDSFGPPAHYYRVTDARGVLLIFSFSPVGGSIQVELALDGKQLALISEEGAESIHILRKDDQELLYCRFELQGATSTLRVDVRPEIRVEWTSLIG